MRTSVIIPVYNGAATVGEAIESVLSQGVDDVEVIAVDDGSIDSTPLVLEKYKPAIKVINRVNGGLCVARNTAVAASSGEYLALLDADDVWRPGRLQLTIEALDRNPNAVMAFSDYVPMDRSGQLLDRSFARRSPSHQELLKRGWPIIPSAVTMRRSALDKVGGFCEEFKGCAGGEDHYMWLLLSECGQFRYVPEPLVIHRRTSRMETVEKYEAGRKTFERLVKRRYGALARARIREGKGFFAGLLLGGAADALDAGNVRGGLKMLFGALRYRPFLLFNPRMFVRVLRRRNVRRVVHSLRQMLG
jgi:glycosyltransferase involved in cell wall biosynthesis